MYKFIFPIRAISKDNEKIFNRHGRPFTSKKFKDFEKLLQTLVKTQIPNDFCRLDDCDLLVGLTFYFDNKVHPDCSNLPKSVLDAFNKVLWKDDRQIKSLIVDVYEGRKESIELTVTKIPIIEK